LKTCFLLLSTRNTQNISCSKRVLLILIYLAIVVLVLFNPILETWYKNQKKAEKQTKAKTYLNQLKQCLLILLMLLIRYCGKEKKSKGRKWALKKHRKNEKNYIICVNIRLLKFCIRYNLIVQNYSMFYINTPINCFFSSLEKNFSKF
jgi:hypothetical protein